ncbi:NAD(P)H-dependent oxidoreductase [Xanthobacteraceae bacterium Astr-EGSB]|uniref:NADPH-dependent FMN reductase n=1 Tax=Astrobacterium formosum TaxID=3069710 RepID=UPI0027B167F0|nr:NAD(P)H-dependent oxidoreductase [Xanthobacteraceae bacterium Astr-EGSB]
MAAPKILVFAGSIRTGSFNARLAALAVKELALADVDVTRISLVDYPLPLYDADLEKASGAPENAVKLKRMFLAHRGIFIASPEYNASVTPLLKNTLDWVSRVREGNEVPLAAYKRRVFALGAASNGSLGGYRSLMALRQILELGCGATVLPEQVAVREAASAFEDDDTLRDERTMRALRTVLERLVETARQLSMTGGER